MSKTRQTFNVNAAMIGDAAKLERVMRAWQPSALFMMNALNSSDPNNVVVRFHNILSEWGGKIVYRPYEDGEANLWRKRSVDAHLDMLARMNASWAWFNVGNEPTTAEPAEMNRMSDWYAEMATKAPARGIRVVLPGGFASGSYNRDQLRAFRTMWQAMGAQRHLKAEGWNVVMLGTHEYGHVDPRYHVDGDNIYDLMTPEKARAHTFKTAADIYDNEPSDNYLILRTENIVDVMAESCNVPRAEFEIDIGDTEKDLDRMPNIETQHRVLAEALDAMNGEKTYGYPKCKVVLEKLYGKPAHEVMADIWEWEEKVYKPYYRFFANFTWSTHNDHPQYWASRYGYHNEDALHTVWTARIPRLGGTVATPIPDTDEVHALIEELPATITYRNIRTDANSTSALVGKLYRDDIVYYHPVPPAPANGGWLRVRKVADGAAGWILGSGVAFTEIVADTPEVALLKQQLTAATTANAALISEKQDLQALIDNYRLLISGVMGLLIEVNEGIDHAVNALDGALESV